MILKSHTPPPCHTRAEDDASLTADEKAILRFQKQRLKEMAGGKFALPDDDDGDDGLGGGGGETLTHLGQSLADANDLGEVGGEEAIDTGGAGGGQWTGRAGVGAGAVTPSAKGGAPVHPSRKWVHSAAQTGAWLLWNPHSIALLLCASPHVQGWASDDDGGLDDAVTRDLHFGGGLFERKAEGADGGEGEGEGGEGQDGQQPQRKSKKEVRCSRRRSRRRRRRPPTALCSAARAPCASRYIMPHTHRLLCRVPRR